MVVHVERDGAVGIIRLDRPPVNAINSQMHGELERAARELDMDRDIRAIVVHGGPKAFAGGADVKEMANLGPAEIAVFGKSLTRALDAIAHLRVPTIAGITGYALGGGFELALATDFRIVADDALLGFPEITLGVIPGAGGTQRLPRLVGTAIAKRMIFTGRPIRGPKAVEFGIAEESVPASEVVATAMAFAHRLAVGATVALETAKRCIDDGLEVDIATGLRIESAGFAGLFATNDQKHGMASFLTDGPGKATFTGR
ncbi:MAG: enoyl-CoA hydratase-related protein [Nakamurella sp.]